MNMYKRKITCLLVSFTVAFLLCVGTFTGLEVRAQEYDESASLAPFVPTPMNVVEKMLELAEVTKNDVVYDLGCGDGRIVVTAAEKYGARGVGVDYNPVRVAEARKLAKEKKVEKLVKIIQQDAMTVDLSEATVVTLYLLASSNVKLRPILEKYLKPGARVVSHDFDMRGWEAKKVVEINNDEYYSHTVYLWVIGEQKPKPEK